jgi:hypothetical protein
LAFGCNLPKFLWIKTVNVTNYLVNKSPTKANSSISHEEMFYYIVLNLSHLCVFGCEAYVHIGKKDRESKLSPQAIKCIFIGYDHQSKAYRCFNPISRKTLITIDIHFNENMFSPTNKIKINGLDHVEDIVIQSLGSSSWTSSSLDISTNVKIQARIHIHPIESSPSHDAIIDDSSFEDRLVSQPTSNTMTT